MKKAVAAVLLAVLLVCAVFSSCGKKEDGVVTGNGNTTRSAAQNAVTNAGDAVVTQSPVPEMLSVMLLPVPPI